MAILIINPEESIGAAQNGIRLFAENVLPPLLPFFILADLMLSLNVPEDISRLLTPVFKKLYGVPGYGAYAFIMSIFSGYPVGAKITSELVRNKYITPRQGNFHNILQQHIRPFIYNGHRRINDA